MVPDDLADLFVTTSDLDSEEHASVQCALQEGVDSSISKTVNAPADATLEDAKDAFEYIYRNGGKSVTFYRDGSRSKQVNTVRKDNQETGDSEEEQKSPGILPRDRPKVASGCTHRIKTGVGKLYVTINEDEDGNPIEVFTTVGKSGGMTESFSEALARQISLNLRSGVSLDPVIDQLENIRSPNIAWDNGESIESVPDGIATALKRYRESEELQTKDDNPETDMHMNHPTTKPREKDDEKKSGDVCPDCGNMMVFREGCEECSDESCGYSKC
jgi:ribonucleoside-diphosphate reductase alpha chain